MNPEFLSSPPMAINLLQVLGVETELSGTD